MVDRLIQVILVGFGKTLGNGVSRILEVRVIVGNWSNGTGDLIVELTSQRVRRLRGSL